MIAKCIFVSLICFSAHGSIIDDLCRTVTADPVKTSDINFRLHTKTIDTIDLKIPADNFAILSKYKQFDINLPTQITIHGWNGTPYELVNTKLVEARLKQGKTNCFIIDYSKPSSTGYFKAVKIVPKVANILADFIHNLTNLGVDIKKVHVIGFSLGGQVAGFTAKHLLNKYNQVLPIITGLDPAGPCFTSERLNKNDANFVKIIYTSMNSVLQSSVGHVNIYPNGGLFQNGCAGSLLDKCAHNRAIEYYAEAMNNATSYKSCKASSYKLYLITNFCDKFVHMGDDVLSITGKFYLNTKSESPYSL